MKQREIVKILEKAGFIEVKGGKGSHKKMKKGNIFTIVSHNGGKDLPEGTVQAIERQTGIKILRK